MDPNKQLHIQESNTLVMCRLNFPYVCETYLKRVLIRNCAFIWHNWKVYAIFLLFTQARTARNETTLLLRPVLR